MGNLDEHFASLRKERKLNLAELARGIGYKNVTKGMNRLRKFEESGDIDTDLLEKLAAFFGTTHEKLMELIESDRAAALEVWKKWATEPIEPFMVVRLIPGFYCEKEIPKEFKTQERQEAFAAEQARKYRYWVWLMLSRVQCVRFDETGKVVSRETADPGGSVGPMMQIAGSKRLFRFSLRPRKTLTNRRE